MKIIHYNEVNNDKCVTKFGIVSSNKLKLAFLLKTNKYNITDLLIILTIHK